MDRRYMRDHHDEDEDRGRRPRHQGVHRAERAPDAEPRYRTDFADRGHDRGAAQDPAARGYGPYRRHPYGQDPREVQQPSAGFSGPGRGDWRELYRDQSYPDRRGFGWGDYDTRSDYDADMPRAYRDRDYRGFGPRSYRRSDARIEEDVNDALTEDRHVDASEITVTVETGEVTLDGTVASRRAKRHAEDCAESVSGVQHVQNNLRVQQVSGPKGSGTDIPS